MKIWLGEEQETLPKSFTLFIQGDKINIEKVLQIAEDRSIKRLYFGAGKQECTDFEALRKIPKTYKVVIETKNQRSIPRDLALKCCIILRKEVKINPKSLFYVDVLKLENNKFVLTFSMEDVTITPLDKNYNLNTKMYNCDKLLYEDGGTEN